MSKRAIRTTRGDRVVDVKEAHRFDPDEFYKVHRGGSGPVVVVFAYFNAKTTSRDKERIGIFGSFEKAQEWAFKLGDDWHCVFCPFVVDEPDFGNETRQ